MRLLAAAMAAAAVVTVVACDRHAAPQPPPPPLPTADARPLLCGEIIPRGVAEVIAGSADLFDKGRLLNVSSPTGNRVIGGSCAVFRSTGKRERVFVVTAQSYDTGEGAATMARSFVEAMHGTDLPHSEGYGRVSSGREKVRDAVGVTSSGKVVIDATIDNDAKGRDPVADMRVLLNLVGPKLAPDWPTPPPGTGAWSLK